MKLQQRQITILAEEISRMRTAYILKLKEEKRNLPKNKMLAKRYSERCKHCFPKSHGDRKTFTSQSYWLDYFANQQTKRLKRYYRNEFQRFVLLNIESCNSVAELMKKAKKEFGIK